jgi:hypothetical protein
MALPIITLLSPNDSESVASPTPNLSIRYEDTDNLPADIKLELDRIGTFDTENYQTQTRLNIESGEEVTFTVATPLLAGYYYWRVEATNADGTTVTETWSMKVELAAEKRTLYLYENIAKHGPEWTKKRASYQYENISKYIEWTKKRGLYQYDNITDEPPFPVIDRLSATKVENGSVVTLYGNGFGYSNNVDITNEDRYLRSYGGYVYIGDTLCNIISWSWDRIEFQLPQNAKTGSVKVELTEPTRRESNLIGLEIVEGIEAAETGLEFFVCDRNNPNTVIAYLDGATNKSFQTLLNHAGSGSFSISKYDKNGGNRDIIKDQNLILCRLDGVDIFKWIIESREPDYVSSNENQMIQVRGRGIFAMLDWGVVYPENMADGELEREFIGYGGAILRTLLLEAKARGCFPGIEIDWTADKDSIGNPFDDETIISFHSGTPLSSVVQTLSEGLGLFDVEMTPNLTLKLYKRKGEDRSDEVIYRPGQGIIEHKNKSDATKVANVLLVEGDDGQMVEVAHPTSQNRWGRREGYLQIRNIKDGLPRYGQRQLEKSSDAEWGIQGTVIEFKDSKGGKIKPFETYENGDWISWYIPPEGYDAEGFSSKLRVKGITTSEDNDTGYLQYTLELNNVMLENEIKMKQSLERTTMFSQSSSLTTPQQNPAPKNHTHKHSLLQDLDKDDHPQYLNEARHNADPHEGIQKVSGVKVSGEDAMTGEVTLEAGNNVSLVQNASNKTIRINASGEGGGGGGGGILAAVSHRTPTNTQFTTTSKTFVDVDANNLKVSFVAPQSGKVLILQSAMASVGGSAYQYWNLRDGDVDVIGTDNEVVFGNLNSRFTNQILVEGLAPGNEYTYKWGFRTSGSEARILIGLTWGAANMTVFSI